LKSIYDYFRCVCGQKNQSGFIIWYLAAAIGAILIFYAVFYFFWNEIKGWFIEGH